MSNPADEYVNCYHKCIILPYFVYTICADIYHLMMRLIEVVL